jgi:glycosyltransferase involved in cell wall biosynthesis
MAFAGSGELQDGLAQAAREAGLPATFLGFVNQSRMPAIYASADVAVLPSDGSETWGLAINEAMACGVPAVVSDAVGCGPDLIEAGGTGEVFPLGDVPAFAQALRNVLGFAPEATRSRLAARIERYGPVQAAEGILRGADMLCRQRLLK